MISMLLKPNKPIKMKTRLVVFTEKVYQAIAESLALSKLLQKIEEDLRT